MTTHRGAYLHALGVIAEAGADRRAARYLWTLPMFHCNGWAYHVGGHGDGRQARLPAQGRRRADLADALTSEGVTHLCAAPTVLTTIVVGAREADPLQEPVQVFVGGAPPAPSLLERAAALNLHVTHLYGLTETYGPIAVCAWNPDWDELPDDEQARAARPPGRRHDRLRAHARRRRGHARRARATASRSARSCMRGDNVMTGYYRDEEATAEAFRGGWFHSGDLGVMHPDGYVELRDRLKDVDHLRRGEHRDDRGRAGARRASVGRRGRGRRRARRALGRGPGRVRHRAPAARRSTRTSCSEFARERLARFKVPKRIEVVDELPKTGTGKIQKFQLREKVS